ncbi:DUF2332 family protein [Brevundimonas sp. 2R-24]|uniref:DUF2332 family protein n=1 Tax=Peiella sedimenti TaxID=3061083 RepID=A0ABT8SP32_9CAUL|nr:DUF2332 family protein [Caulobacteraceae bacterium XZ-24]
MSEAQVRSAFADQARVCGSLGSPFTAQVCALVAERLGRSTAVGRRMLDWPGVPDAHADALPLRFCGALHALARAGIVDAVRAAWPPAPTPDDEMLWAAITAALEEQGEAVARWLDGPPQTNEVGRSGPLMAGLLVLAERFGLPFSLYELGSSAGLNLNLDRYAFDLGGVRAGDPASSVRLSPDWSGPPLAEAEVRVVARRGVDLSPLDPTDPATAERLLAYVWADQRERVERLEAALGVARAHPPEVERADGADWLERVLKVEPEPGLCRVVMHTIALQYFPPEGRARVAAHLEQVGAQATEAAPLAWLAYEAAAAPDAEGKRWAELTLTTWPGAGRRLLARGHPHGTFIAWAV